MDQVDYFKEVRQRIKIERARFNMSQTDLSKKIGGTPQSVSRIEKEGVSVSIGKLQRILKVFGLRIKLVIEEINQNN